MINLFICSACKATLHINCIRPNGLCDCNEDHWPNGIIGMPVMEIAIETVKAIKRKEQ